MTNTRRLVRIFIGLILVAAFAFYLFKNKAQDTLPVTTPEQEETAAPHFSERGVVVMGNPGLKPYTYYLVYEKPGAPALTVELKLDEKSMCVMGGQPIICMALSRTLDSFNKHILIEGYRAGDVVTVKTFAVLDEERKFGFIRSITANNQNYLVEIDPVEFLSGDAAITAGVEDTSCTQETISECIPSLNNDFYIRNLDTKTETYILDSSAQIDIFANPGSPVLKDVPLATFVKEYNTASSLMKSYTFKYTLNGMTLTSLEEQYTP